MAANSTVAVPKVAEVPTVIANEVAAVLAVAAPDMAAQELAAAAVHKEIILADGTDIVSTEIEDSEGVILTSAATDQVAIMVHIATSIPLPFLAIPPHRSPTMTQDLLMFVM